MESMDDSEEYFILLYGIILFYSAYTWLRSKSSKGRRFFSRNKNLDRNWNGFYEVAFKKMEKNEEEFFRVTRMSVPLFDMLLSFLEKKLTKRRTCFTIVPEARLALTLLYLSQGTTHQMLGWSFKIGRSTAREIVMETCSLIWEVLSPFYVCEPNLEDYELIATDFENLWNLPNCVGALDGKHISIEAPAHSGSQYYNYKNFFSIVLLAACDAKYTFTMIDVGAYGSQSDGGILSESQFGKKLFSDHLPLPNNRTLPNSEVSFPYFFIGDPAFPLKNNIMRPYPGKCLSFDKKVFNYRISRARACIENTFGILVSRWRVLRNSLLCSPENAKKVVLATVALHNFIRFNCSNFTSYCPPSYVDSEDTNGNIIPGGWRREIGNETLPNIRLGSNNASRSAFRLRDVLKNYLFKEGAISLQNKIN